MESVYKPKSIEDVTRGYKSKIKMFPKTYEEQCNEYWEKVRKYGKIEFIFNNFQPKDI